MLRPMIAFFAGLPLFACSSEQAAPATFDAGARPRGPVAIDAGACKAEVNFPVLLPSPHIGEDVMVSYNSNPPSSGPHFPVWAAFKEYEKPVDSRYLVHDLEHGAVVLSYRCASPAECPDLVSVLRGVRDAAPADPLCVDVRNRIVIVPTPSLSTRIAAAAWGVTYTADCADAASLASFVRENYAKAPENFCSPGIEP